MPATNQTFITGFILLGLTEDPKLLIPLFVFFLLVYVITVLGNCCMMALIWIAPRLHTPMYFLLSSLSFVDLCYSSVIIPNMLGTFLSISKEISFTGCVTQFFFFITCSATDSVLLSAMAYDRYVAICKPLRYSLLMSKTVYLSLIAASYSIALFNGVLHTGLFLRLNFCGPNTIAKFYCDGPPLFTLSCSDTTINEVLMFVSAVSVTIVPFLIIIISYVYIIICIIGIRSSKGKLKAFSTCASHFTCVIMFYNTLFYMYLKPSSSYSIVEDKVVSLFYTVIIPMLNPFIYSLRNKEVKGALKKIMNSSSIEMNCISFCGTQSSGFKLKKQFSDKM